MAMYKVLDIDVDQRDGWYRLRRDTDTTSSVVYVYVADIEIFPPDARTSSDELLRELRRFEDWNTATWDTLTISQTSEGPCYTTDSFKPHSIFQGPDEGLLRVDWADMITIKRVRSRVHIVSVAGETFYLKVARFPHESKFLKTELDAYRILHNTGTKVAPSLKGLVYEGTPERTTGLLLQALEGRPPTSADAAGCTHALEQIHQIGLCHGDINKHNFIVSAEQIYLIDFEQSFAARDDAMAAEKGQILTALSDTSGVGAPWAS